MPILISPDGNDHICRDCPFYDDSVSIEFVESYNLRLCNGFKLFKNAMSFPFIICNASRCDGQLELF